MLIVKRLELESGGAEQIEPRIEPHIARPLDPTRLYSGFIYQGSGLVSGDCPMTGLRETQETYVRWLQGVNPRYWVSNSHKEALR
jgi:hypothetical protein